MKSIKAYSGRSQPVKIPAFAFNVRAIFGLVGLATGLFVVGLFWFSAFSYHTLMGDDLQALIADRQGIYVSSFTEGLTSVLSGTKYRPVFTSLFSLLIDAFDTNFQAYVIFNLLLELVNVGLVGLIVYRFGGRHKLIALTAAVMVLFARFNFYYVLQLYGFMEGLALLFLLLVVYFSVRAYLSKSSRAFIYPSLFFFFLIFTHERYMVVVGFLVLLTLLAPGAFKSWLSRLLWTGLPLLVLLSNFFVKSFLLHVGFIADAGRPINPLADTLGFLYQGTLNLIGFNVGPDYLSALNIDRTGGLGYVFGFVSLGLLLVIFGLHLREWAWPFRQEKWLAWLRGAFLFSALLGPLLLSASITTLQEYRWLYSPYVVLVLGVAYLLGTIKPGWLATGLALTLLVVSMVSNNYYRGYNGNVYFFWSMAVADSAKVNIVDKYGPELARRENYIVTNGNVSLRNFVFLDSYFFNLYAKRSDIRINFVQSADDILVKRLDPTKLLVFALQNSELVEITPAVAAAMQNQAAAEAKGTPYLDFVTRFQDGKISDSKPIESPTKQGAFLMNLPGSLGSSSNLTIISGFNYRYEHLTLKPQSALVFSAAKIYDIGDSATLYVEATDKNGRKQRIFSAELAEADKTSPKWQNFTVPFKADLDKEVTLTFGVESATGDAYADWVGLNHIYLVAP